MSSTQPPAGSTPPPGEPTPPPPPAAPATDASYPPPTAGTIPPPPPPAGAYGAPAPGAPGAAYGAGQPGNLLDRFLARLIDGIIIGVVVGIISVVIRSASDSWLLENAVTAVLAAVLYVGYFAYQESASGQTIGKKIMKLKVVGPGGAGNPTMEQAVRRNIWLAFGIAGVVPVIGALIGGLAELAAVILIAVGINSDTVRRQHWFDKFAGGTQVLKAG